MACVAFVAVWSSRNSRDGVQEADLSLVHKSVTGHGTPELAISDEQRGHIFEVVMRISDAPVAKGPTPEIADALPEQVPMQDAFDDRILIVNPSSRLVVAMIPRYKLVP
jgi:hypothetical protein